MKILLLLVLMFCQDTTDKLLQDLSNDDPIVRQNATKQLIEHENDLIRFKALTYNTSDLEVKWRLAKVIQAIENNQKFRSMSSMSPLITLKFEGTVGDLFVKLSAITGQAFDARAFGDNKVVIDCVETPLFKVLDAACKQVGYDWEIVYHDSKDNTLDQYPQSPILNYTNVINLCGLGMSDRTPNYTGPGFKMQAAETSFSINNKFNETITEMSIQFKYAQDMGLKFAVGPKMTYTKILTDSGAVLSDRSAQARYLLVHAPPATKTISVKGKAAYRIPMKIETITLKGLETIESNPTNSVSRDFADYPDVTVVMDTNRTISVYTKGSDNIMKERFTGKFSITKVNGKVVLENGGGTGNGYIYVNDDHLQFYIYGGAPNSGDDAISIITFEYITEFRDVSFDFAIDNIPLY